MLRGCRQGQWPPPVRRARAAAVRPARHSHTLAAATAAQLAPTLPADAVLEWACAGWRPDDGRPPQLGVRVAEGPFGRGLFAARDATPGEVLLSVGWDRVFKGSDGELHWASCMAAELLRRKHARTASSLDTRPWIAALPADVHTPIAYSEAELLSLSKADAYVAAELRDMREAVEGCWQVGVDVPTALHYHLAQS
jgi:hypothetical protein